MLEYTSEAKVKLNWDEQYKMILFDHLIPFNNPYTNSPTYVPDGSYDGFKLEKGVQKVNDTIEGEFMGIINYCVIALIQIEMGSEENLEMPA